jgi:formylglycine-generating enzyme required for sulfatase activity
VSLSSWLKVFVDFFKGSARDKGKFAEITVLDNHPKILESEARVLPLICGETINQEWLSEIQKYTSRSVSVRWHDVINHANRYETVSPIGQIKPVRPFFRPIDQLEIISPDLPLPDWFQGEIPTELLRLARAHCEERVYRQILADWVECYGGEEGRLLCRFFRRDEVLRHDASTWQTLSAFEARLVAPFSDLVLGIGDRIVLPLTETQNITMGWVPPGQSWLGGGGGEEGTRPFTLKKDLWCGICTVTQEQWQAVMGNNPSCFEELPKNPVEQVSYYDVEEFLQKVNAANSRSGFLYRLPSADEWEYILRGGPISKPQSQYDFYFAQSQTDLTPLASNDLPSTQANFDSNYPDDAGVQGLSLEATSAVGKYLPNPLGMFEMHGNVNEMMSNKEFSSVGVMCGGSWRDDWGYCRASIRCRFDLIQGTYELGFRLLAVPVGRVGQVDS